MTSAREQLLDVIHFTECANHGTIPDALLDAYAAEVLAAARGRVAALPTANDGQLIAAYRDVVLNTITAGGAR